MGLVVNFTKTFIRQIISDKVIKAKRASCWLIGGKTFYFLNFVRGVQRGLGGHFGIVLVVNDGAGSFHQAEDTDRQDYHADQYFHQGEPFLVSACWQEIFVD